MNEEQQHSRYERQVLLKELGERGQVLLGQAKVLVIGAGGLGCPALQYLVASGIGQIGIVDGDVIQLSNLHRQTLYDTADIGKMKAIVAREKLQRQNPGCKIISYTNYLSNQNAWDIIATYDIVLDGSDNFSTRYLLNDVCVLQNKPLVYAAVYKYEGQLSVFCANGKDQTRTANYRDIFPSPPLPGTVPNCNEAGVLGVLPGIMGTMQAAEVIKLVTGIGTPLINQLLSYQVLTNEQFTVELSASASSRNAPATEAEIELFDYNVSCDLPVEQNNIEIRLEQFEALLQDPEFQVVDVREWNEEPIITGFTHIQIPLSELMSQPGKNIGNKVIFICQTGVRSKQAVQWALKQTYMVKAFSLKGGLMNWLNFQSA